MAHGGMAPARLALALLAVLCAPAAGDYSLLMWNPHWECFVKNETGCRQAAEAALNNELVSSDVDFANVVELDDDLFRPPVGWAMLVRDCSRDRTALIYNIARWRPSTLSNSSFGGCMVQEPTRHDRPFVVQQFDEVHGIRRVIVIGAHYPHHPERAALRDALAAVVTATGVRSVILLADTNEFRTVPSTAIMQDIGTPAGTVVSTELRRTCCFNDGFKEEHTFDRIMANFGYVLDTTVLFDPLPDWARTGAFHKAVRTVLAEEVPHTQPWTWLFFAGLGLAGCVLVAAAAALVHRRIRTPQASVCQVGGSESEGDTSDSARVE